MPVITTQVFARNNIGQFAARCREAAERTVHDMLELGAREARANAPVGHKPDPRTVPLVASIEVHQMTATSGTFSSNARHAAPIEFGAGPHDIPGDVSFWWEREAKWWEPGENTINHPGNAAQPFMEPAARAVFGSYVRIAEYNFPG